MWAHFLWDIEVPFETGLTVSHINNIQKVEPMPVRGPGLFLSAQYSEVARGVLSMSVKAERPPK